MYQYLNILQNVVDKGKRKPTRTGIDSFSITGAMFEHDMADGFPLLTTKKMSLRNICAELEFFIAGYNDKQILQKWGCHIWDDWCNPQKVGYGTDEETKESMRKERDLGPIYGVQWRSWPTMEVVNGVPCPGEIDQLLNLINTLKDNPLDRRMIVSAWNPADLDKMALPPCHYSFQVLSDGETVDLLWNQRSVDVPLGLPYNIASYGMLLLLIARTVGMKPGKLIGQLADVHIYENQLPGIKNYLKRTPYLCPKVTLPDKVKSIFDWGKDDFIVTDYIHHKAFPFEIAV